MDVALKVMPEKGNRMDRHKLWEFIVSGIVLGISYFSPTKQFLLIMTFLVLCDLITGTIASMKMGYAFSWKKLMNKFGIYIIYWTSILLAFVMCNTYAPKFPGLELISGMIAWKELKSIDKNIKVVTGFSLFYTILDKIKVSNDTIRNDSGKKENH